MTTEQLNLTMRFLLEQVQGQLKVLMTTADVAANDLEQGSIFAAAGGIMIIEEKVAEAAALTKALRTLTKELQQ